MKITFHCNFPLKPKCAYMTGLRKSLVGSRAETHWTLGQLWWGRLSRLLGRHSLARRLAMAVRGAELRLGIQLTCEPTYCDHVSRRRWSRTLFPLFVGFDVDTTNFGSHFLRICAARLFQSAGPLLSYPAVRCHFLRARQPLRGGQVKGQPAQNVLEPISERILVKLRPIELGDPVQSVWRDAIEELCQTFDDRCGMALKRKLQPKW